MDRPEFDPLAARHRMLSHQHSVAQPKHNQAKASSAGGAGLALPARSRFGPMNLGYRSCGKRISEAPPGGFHLRQEVNSGNRFQTTYILRVTQNPLNKGN